MGIVQRINHWSHAQYNILHLVVRVILGVILVLKGISFISNAALLSDLISQSRFQAIETFLVSYVTFAHLFGGIFLILGLLTRLAVALQIPALIGAVFFINPLQSDSLISGEFILSIVVLCLLIYYLIKGPGVISMDAYLKKNLL